MLSRMVSPNVLCKRERQEKRDLQETCKRVAFSCHLEWDQIGGGVVWTILV